PRRQRARRGEAADGLRLPPADHLLPARRARGADDRADRVGGEGNARRVRRRAARNRARGGGEPGARARRAAQPPGAPARRGARGEEPERALPVRGASGRARCGRPPAGSAEGSLVAENQYHEPPEELSAETRTFARMITSLTEEVEAISWYEQRISIEPDD